MTQVTFICIFEYAREIKLTDPILHPMRGIYIAKRELLISWSSKFICSVNSTRNISKQYSDFDYVM